MVYPQMGLAIRNNVGPLAAYVDVWVVGILQIAFTYNVGTAIDKCIDIEK